MTESDRQYSAGTVEHNAKEIPLSAAGKKSGHGTIAWQPAPEYDMPASPDWPPSGRPPVIALLDTGVQSHPWLPQAGELSFVLDAEEHGWQSPVTDDDADADPSENYSSHWGHATFIAGLIRLAAPTAQVLSMRVMDKHGKVSEGHIAEALNWLADHPDLGVNIVLMALGRQEDPADKHLDDLRSPIRKLSAHGVRFVASAGNDGAERPVYPAAFAVEPDLSVLSVGALATPTERARYSNFGPWVTKWQNGTNIISIMPLTTKSADFAVPGSAAAAAPAAALDPDPGYGYAWWNGTSFAAATVAGKLAAALPVSQALPEPAVGS